MVLAELVRAQAHLIDSALRTIAQLDAGIGALLLSHPKAELLAPLPRIGEINLAQVIAEIGPLLDRCENVDQAAAACGVAPVTRQSGKSRNVQFRFSSNARARVALTCFADNSRHSSSGLSTCIPMHAGAGFATLTPFESSAAPGSA